MEFSIRVVFGTVLRTQVGLYSRGIEWIYAANSWWRNESNSHSCRMMIHDDLRMRGSYLIASDLNINYQSSFCESFPHFYQLVGEFKVESIIGWTSLKPSQTTGPRHSFQGTTSQIQHWTPRLLGKAFWGLRPHLLTSVLRTYRFQLHIKSQITNWFTLKVQTVYRLILHRPQPVSMILQP